MKNAPNTPPSSTPAQSSSDDDWPKQIEQAAPRSGFDNNPVDGTELTLGPGESFGEDRHIGGGIQKTIVREEPSPNYGNRETLRKNCAKAVRIIDEVKLLQRDGQLWERQKQEIISTGSIRDERKISMVSVLDTKLSMLPFALAKQEAVLSELLAPMHHLQSESNRQADPVIARLNSEPREEVRGNLALFIRDETRLDEAVEFVFGRTPWGSRLRELSTTRRHMMPENIAECLQALAWGDAVDKLAADWEEQKRTNARVPADA